MTLTFLCNYTSVHTIYIAVAVHNKIMSVHNHFYLRGSLSPRDAALNTGDYVFDSHLTVLTFFLQITSENSSIDNLAFGSCYANLRNTRLFTR